ncbi:MAG: TIGR00282 family metallophosphoesterase [Myxococcales bacterium]|nr:TIGR00282 family metallophosphoesterase [Myxococcales bacterium]
MKVLMIGDVCGKPGRQILTSLVPKLIDFHKLDFVVANGENMAGGMGVTPETCEELFKAGVDVITSGNHIWAKQRDIVDYIGREKRLIRPANYPAGAPGAGAAVARARGGEPVGVVNLIGRTFMGFSLSCPFEKADEILDGWGDSPRVILVDMHGEATSEKQAMGHYLDGRVSAVVGTHTHVTTADEAVLPRGTAFITDLGMTGAHAGVIGMRAAVSIRRFKSGIPQRFEPETEGVRLSGVLIEISEKTGRAKSITRIRHDASEAR